ncbi:MAG: hypothetical protein ACYCS9_10040 [Candidatus Dormibacteria bacterium]
MAMDIMGFLRQRAGDFRCPVCRRSLADCELRQLAHQGPHYTVQVTCRHCSMAFLVALEVQGGAEAEATPSQMDPISPDELLELHRQLRDFEGPLTELLERPSRRD